VRYNAAIFFASASTVVPLLVQMLNIEALVLAARNA
jgi:hypothetical protein